MLRPQDRGPLFVRLEASPFFAWLSRWAREGPAGVDSSRLVWTPSGPEMPRAPGRQGLSKGSVVHLAIVKEAGTLCWGGSWHTGTWPGDLGSVDPSPAWALSSWALMASFSVCSKPHSGIQTQNGGISARQMI